MRISFSHPWISLDEIQGDYSVRYKGQLLTPGTPPGAAADKKAVRFSLEPGSLVLIPSPLLFHGLSSLINHAPEDCFFIFLEGCEPLLRLAESAFPEELQDNPRVWNKIIGSSDDLLSFFSRYNISTLRRVQLITLSRGYTVSPGTYQSWENLARAWLRQFWRNKATLTVMGRLYIDNLLANLPRLAGGEPLARFTTEKPILLTGAGESLEYSLPFIREIRADFYLVSVDTALPILLESGITPDLVIVVESQHANLRDFLAPGAMDLPCLFDLTSYSGLIRLHRGPRGFFVSRYAELLLWDRLEAAHLMPPALPPLGSVGLAALYLCRDLTGANILYTGLDFCFFPGKTHARGAPSHTALLSRCSRIIPLEDFSHGLPPLLSRHYDRMNRGVLSSPNLRGYHDLLSLFKDQGRVRDMGSCSLPSVIPFAERPQELLRAHGSSGLTSPPPCSSEALTTFLEHLEEDLKKLRAEGHRWLAGDRGGGQTARLASLLGRLDFLYTHFPDSPDFPEIGESFLKRVLVFSERCRGRIQRNLEAGR